MTQPRAQATPDRTLRLLFVAVLVLGFSLVLFSNGGRLGLYTDDYAHKRWAYDIEQEQWRPRIELNQPYLRPLGQVMVSNLANLLPDRELPLRLLWASVHLAKVLLASFLAYRLVRSPVVLVVTGAFLLFPVQAHEAVFWHSGAASALLGTLAPLVTLNLLLSAVKTDGRWGLYAALGLLVYTLIPQFYEQALACIVVLPLFCLVEKPVSKQRLRRSLILVALAVGLLALYWFFVLRHSPDIPARGGLQTSPESVLLDRLPSVLRGLGSPLGIILGLVLVAGTTLLFAWAARQETGPPSTRRIVVLYGTGCIWLGIGLLPAIALGGQYVESRLLYFPWVALAFIIASGIGLVMTRLPRRWANLLAVGLACLLALQELMMAGFGQVYQLRYEHDQKQLTALSQAVPSLPTARELGAPDAVFREGFIRQVSD